MAARYCAKCGHEIASTAMFCPSCGTPVNAGGRPATGVDAAVGVTRRMLIPAMIAALAVLVVVIIILISRPHEPVIAARSEPVPAPSVLSAPTAAPQPAPPVTSAPSQPAPPTPPVTNSASKKPPALPPEDARYLEFLQQIDQRRIALDNDFSGASQLLQSAQAMQGEEGDTDDPQQHNSSVQGSVGKMSQGYSDYTTKWNALTRDFRSVVPPPDCSLLANDYLQFLTDYAATISKLQVALLNHDIGAAMGVQGAQKQIDTDAMQADNQITQLCNRYGVPKPFSIQTEGSSSPLTGL
jgi:hypothetical protein